MVTALMDGLHVDSSLVDETGTFRDIQVFSAGKDVTFTVGELIATIDSSTIDGIDQAESVKATVGGADFLKLTASETSLSPQAITNRQVLFDLSYDTQGVN